ncbi:hypothetical protein BD779DRAFT_1670103 [Infundibulicybe gibba]|nr:hypothetical protein BD779DRAFT_1670103 [Infundibulicybe gibba]
MRFPLAFLAFGIVSVSAASIITRDNGERGPRPLTITSATFGATGSPSSVATADATKDVSLCYQFGLCRD